MSRRHIAIYRAVKRGGNMSNELDRAATTGIRMAGRGFGMDISIPPKRRNRRWGRWSRGKPYNPGSAIAMVKKWMLPWKCVSAATIDLSSVLKR